MLLRVIKGTMLERPLAAGFKIPGTTGGTVGIKEIPTDEGLVRLQAALLRLESRAPTKPDPIFGQFSHGDWLTLQCRHAEVHMSFYRLA